MKTTISLFIVVSLLLVFPQQTFASLNDGLTAHYPFNGNADDASGNGHHGTVINATLGEDRFGNAESAYSFDGQGDYILIGQQPNFPSWSSNAVSVWFLNNGGGSWTGYGQKIITKATWYSDFYSDVYPDGGIQYCTSMPWVCIHYAEHDFRDSEWHHLVMNRSGTSGEMWVDGELVGTSNQMSSSNNGIDIIVGYSVHGDTLQRNYWSGQIDDIRIYDRILTEPEIQSLYGGAAATRFVEHIAATFAGGLRPAVLDFDGDTDMDIVCTGTNEVAWFQNDGNSPPTFTKHTIRTQAGNIFDAAYSADLDADNDMDVVSGLLHGNDLVWSENNGSSPPTFAHHTLRAGTDDFRDVHVDDVDGDGDLDALSASSTNDRLSWYESDGGTPPVFTERNIKQGNLDFFKVETADLDGDDDIDVLAGTWNDARVSWYENDGLTPPGFTERLIGTGSINTGIRVVDVDEDGDPDVVAAYSGSDKVVWYESDGGSPPSFTERVIDGTITAPSYNIAAQDIDGDDDVDVLVSDAGTAAVWYENSGDPAPSFTKHTLSGPGTGVAAGDLDGDGDPDLVLPRSGNLLYWYENTITLATVRPSNEYPTPGSTIVACVDIDIDATSGSLGNYAATLTWDAAILNYQSFSGGDSPFDTPIVNESSTAGGSLVFSDADATGSMGQVQVLCVYFDVIGATGTTSSLDLELTSAFAANTFADLMPSVIDNDNTVVVTDDQDGDGILDVIDGDIVGLAFLDMSSDPFNESFTDQHLGGTSFGFIVNRGGLTLTVLDEPNPEGFRVQATGGTGNARLKGCGNRKPIKLTAGDDIVITCSDLTMRVIVGPVEIELSEDTFVSVPDGGIVTVTELGNEQVQVTNDSVDVTILVVVGGEVSEIAPGESDTICSELPIVAPPVPITVECNSQGGVPVSDAQIQTWLASAAGFSACGGVTLTDDAPTVFPVETTTVTFTALDDFGNVVSDTSYVTVEDTTPPELSVHLTPDNLWPPNHRMFDIEASVTAGDACSTTSVTLSSVTSNEADNGDGDGNTVNDIQGVDIGTADYEFALRAERAGEGAGRIYTAVYSAIDEWGNSSAAAGLAVIPHDKGGITEPIDLLLVENGNGTLASWTEVPGALSYNVIRGTLGRIVETEVVIDLGTVICIEKDSQDTSTPGWEDAVLPISGEGFFYLVEYYDGNTSSYGTESAQKQRAPGAGDCQ